MRNSFYCLVLFFTTFMGNSQVVISGDIYTRHDNVSLENFKKFKNTTTIFILSNLYKKEDYEKVLNETWKVTSFQIVNIKNFDFKNYLDDKYSFVQLKSRAWSEQGRGPISFSAIEVFLLDNTKILKKFDKIKDKFDKCQELYQDNKIFIGGVHLSPNFPFLERTVDGIRGKVTVFSQSNYDTKNINAPDVKDGFPKEMWNKVFNEKSFLNFDLGHLKNYFQKINALITEEKNYELRKLEKEGDLKKLKNEILFIPDFVKLEYHPVRIKETERNSEDLKELLGDYKYKYQLASVAEIEKKILNNDNFYYLDYVKVNNEKFVQIKNSLTGNVVLRYSDVGYNLEDDDFKKITKEINSIK